MRGERPVAKPRLAVRLPRATRLVFGPRAGETQPAALVGSDLLVEPREPRQVEGAAEIAELTPARERHRRRHRLELRRRLDGRQPLHRRRIRQARHADLPVAVGLRGEPRDRVVSVRALLPVGIEDTLRAEAPAHVLDRHHVARAGGAQREVGRRPLRLLAVRCPDESAGKRPARVGSSTSARSTTPSRMRTSTSRTIRTSAAHAGARGQCQLDGSAARARRPFMACRILAAPDRVTTDPWSLSLESAATSAPVRRQARARCPRWHP